MSGRNAFFRWSPLVFFTAALAVFLVLFFRYQRKPEILEIDRLTASAGDRIELTGRFFGDGTDDAKLYIGDQMLTSTGILEWEKNRITARVPRSDGAVLVRVKTRSGLSRGVVLGDAARFPRVEYGSWHPGVPFVKYVEPLAGGPGSPVTVHGEGFGENRGSGTVWINRSDSSSLLGAEEPDLSRYAEAAAVDDWSDSTIKFWVPEGVASGSVYVKKAGNISNPVPFEVNPAPGHYNFGTPRRWSIRQDVSISRIGAFPGNSLYLRIPRPVEGPGQGVPAVLNRPDSKDSSYLREENGLDIFRLDELKPGETRTLSRQLATVISPVQTVVNPDLLKPYDPNHPELAAALAADSHIRPDLVRRTSVRVVGGLRDDWRKSRAIYDYVIDLLQWSDNPPSRQIPDFITTRAADSEGYSFLFCSLARAAGVPARPVGGILIDAGGETRRWWWAEIWIEGLGWVPLDPALGDDESGDSSEENLREYYFGGLDDRHIAFSRGILRCGTLQPHPKLNVPDAFYSLQDVWEEVSGNLYSYHSRWPLPRVTAVY